jgi:hypothetical protein
VIRRRNPQTERNHHHDENSRLIRSTHNRNRHAKGKRALIRTSESAKNRDISFRSLK